MALRQLQSAAQPLIPVFGGVLFLLALLYHLFEAARLGQTVGPLLALLIDGIPALALVYGGFWLRTREFSPAQETRILGWSVIGVVLWVSIMGLSMGVRMVEGRTIPEPGFELLLAADAGAFAGFVAGYFHTRARRDAQQASRANDALSFVNGILRHDIKNDLTVVRGGADLIEAKASGDDVLSHAEMIREKADEATELVNNTGVIAETLTGEATFRPTDLTAMSTEAVNRVEEVYDVTVTTEVPETAEVLGNEGLSSVLDNLLENAAEHSDADEPRITASIDTAPETVRLEIRDNGPGIPDEEKETIFESREEGTHGGGLYLVKTLVEAYGGSIDVGDNEPHGAVFTVELPRVEGE